MVILNNNDMFSVRLTTLIADYDHETLINLYEPLIGYSALALYFTFIAEANYQKVNSLSNHEALLARMQMSPGDFLKARKSLEAVGLVRTFLENNGGAKIYHYELYAPKTPEEFFNDTLLYGLLISYIGEMDAKRMNLYYALPATFKGEEISASFKDVFHPDLENSVFLKALKSDPTKGRNRARMKLEFSFTAFFEHLKTVSQLGENSFSKGELNEILRLASLNGVGEEAAASIVANFYDQSLPKGKRVDFKEVSKAFQEETNYSYLSSFKGNNAGSSLGSRQVSSKSALGQKVNIMETVSPKDYLSILQNGTEPATPDLNLINYLSKKFHLTNGVLNALIDYTLAKNKNVLSKPYMEKICASLVRENIQTALDAMNYLKSISGGKKKVKEYQVEEIKEEEIKPKATSKKINKENKEEDDQEWDTLMAELEDMGDDTDDGKA